MSNETAPSDQDTSADTTAQVQPLSAPEWHGLLGEHNYTLRVTDGTKEGSWHFWTETKHEGGSEWLHAQRFDWTMEKRVGTSTLADALSGDVTTQLVKRYGGGEDE